MDRSEIRRSLESSGLRCTPQRFAVLTFLMGQNRHATAADIFEAVNSVNPSCSRATAYNALRDLVSAGLVREVSIGGRAAYFEIKGARHHHFICDDCGSVEDVEWRRVRMLSPPRPALRDDKRIVRECEIILRGLCAKCAGRTSRKSFDQSEGG